MTLWDLQLLYYYPTIIIIIIIISIVQLNVTYLVWYNVRERQREISPVTARDTPKIEYEAHIIVWQSVMRLLLYE